MRRRRHQQGSLKIARNRYIAQFWEDGHRRNRTLGTVRKISKTEALDKLEAILLQIKRKHEATSKETTFGDFVTQIYLPFYRRKWREDSTTGSNLDRLNHHLSPEFDGRTLGSFTRNELQDFLDRKASSGKSFSTVDHLRWDLHQIFEMAVAEDYLPKNPATLLFTPPEAKRAERRVMTLGQVSQIFCSLDLRELVICKLATIAGMRPSEIFGLKWRHIEADHINVEQRLYRGRIGSPKNNPSKRSVALSQELQVVIGSWKSRLGDPHPETWVFPSETRRTPVAKDNCWRRWIAPRLKPLGLKWVNFQVMRRTHSSLMGDLKVDPKITADQLGHSVDVDQNVYRQTAVGPRKEALDTFEAALKHLNTAGQPSRVM